MTPCDQVVEYMQSTDTATAKQIAERFGWPVSRARYAVWKSMQTGQVEKARTIAYGSRRTAVYRANPGRPKP
jgi:hypothetical protein